MKWNDLLAECYTTPGPVLHQLRDDDDDAVASQRRGRAGVQRLRTLPQTARRQPAVGHAQGRHPDAQTQAQIVVVLIVVIVGRRRSFDAADARLQPRQRQNRPRRLSQGRQRSIQCRKRSIQCRHISP